MSRDEVTSKENVEGFLVYSREKTDCWLKAIITGLSWALYTADGRADLNPLLPSSGTHCSNVVQWHRTRTVCTGLQHLTWAGSY